MMTFLKRKLFHSFAIVQTKNIELKLNCLEDNAMEIVLQWEIG